MHNLVIDKVLYFNCYNWLCVALQKLQNLCKNITDSVEFGPWFEKEFGMK